MCKFVTEPTEQKGDIMAASYETLVHPLVLAWLQAQAVERGMSVAALVAEILKNAYAATLPMRGPCATCGETHVYMSLDLQCPRCWNEGTAALLERTRRVV